MKEQEKKEIVVESNLIIEDAGNKLPPKEKEAEPKVKILIEQQEGVETQERVFVSVNGYAYSIKRGIPVEVPESVVRVLETSIQTKMYQNVESGEITYRDVPRVNFRIIK